MIYLIIAFISSLIINLFILKAKKIAFLDKKDGVQKFHTWDASRTGGIGIFISLWIAYIGCVIAGKGFSNRFFMVLVSAIPVFLGGIVEDITKNVRPRTRLIAAFLSGILAVLLLQANLDNVDIQSINYFLNKYYIFSVFFTAFALAGVSNSINIIDGFNGLASGVCIIIFFSYAYIAFLVNDIFLLYLNLIIASSILGFFFLNYPFGYIFLGDGGAYLIGFLTGLNGVLLTKYHTQVSAWFPFLLLIYPIWETIFSIFRRYFITSKCPFTPDNYHLHSLIYKKITLKKFKDINIKFKNSFTSPYLWLIQSINTIPALIFWKNKIIIISFCFLYILFYLFIYYYILKLENKI